MTQSTTGKTRSADGAGLLRTLLPGSDTLRNLLVAIPAALLFIALFHFGSLKSLDYCWLDALTLHVSRPCAFDERIVRVQIDDETFRALGVKNPMPKRLFTRCFRAVSEMGARVSAVDIYLHPSLSRAEDDELLRTVKKPERFVFVTRTSGSPLPFDGRMTADRFNLASPELHYEKGGARMRSVGVTSVDRRFFTFSFLTLSLFEGSEIAVSGVPGTLLLPPGQVAAIGARRLRLSHGRMLVNFARGLSDASFPLCRFEDILLGRADPALFRGRIAVFFNRRGVDLDEHATPVGTLQGSTLQAYIIKTLLDGAQLCEVRSGAVAALTILLAILSAWILALMRPLPGAASFAGMLALLGGISAALHARGGFLPVAAPALTLLTSWLLITLQGVGRIERELEVTVELMEEVNRASGWKSAPHTWMQTMLGDVCRAVDAPVGWVQCLDENGAFSLAASRGIEGGASPEELDGGLCRLAAESAALQHREELRLEKAISPFEKRLKIDSLLAVPLAGSRGTLAVMALGRRLPTRFTPRHAQQLLTTGLLAGALLENVKLSGRLQKVFIEAVASLAKTVDARDPYTYGHSSRVCDLGAGIARRLALSPEEIRRVELAGILHDIGKIGVPEAILRKTAKLDDEEFATMKRHPEIAAEILGPLDSLYSLLPLVSGHHEKLDGTGYPRGLKGAEIPRGAQVLAVADIFDALTTERPYRKPSTPQEALRIMREQFGAHLDAAAVDALEEHLQSLQPAK